MSGGTMCELSIITFIKENPNNWEEILKCKPYSLFVKRKGNYVIFNYNQFESDMSIPLVKEARGLIVRADTLCPVRMAFTKFFNYGEGTCADIDWSTARVQSKIDGSLMSLWFDEGEWRLSTNGMIDASEANVNSFSDGQINDFAPTYDKLFQKAYLLGVEENRYKPNLLDSLNKNYCYTFEICSPYNKVVVEWEKPLLFHTGTRDMNTLQELNIDIGIPRPEEFPLHSADGVVNAAKCLPTNNEGYVVVDADWNRVKIKSPWYVLHHHAETDNIGFKTLFNTYLAGKGEVDEFLAYFPKYRDSIKTIERVFDSYTQEHEKEWNLCVSKGINLMNKKDFANWIFSHEMKNTGFLFEKFNNPDLPAKEFVRSRLGLYDIIKSRIKLNFSEKS